MCVLICGELQRTSHIQVENYVDDVNIYIETGGIISLHTCAEPNVRGVHGGWPFAFMMLYIFFLFLKSYYLQCRERSLLK